MDQILNMLSSVGFNWHVALANFVNFLIILFILNRFVFNKIGKTISLRENVIKEGLDNAEKAKEALAEAGNEREKIIAHAEKDGHEIINQAHTKAELLAVSIKDQAEDEAHQILEEARSKKQEARMEAEKEFAQAAPKMVAELARRALRENMTEESNNDLIARVSK